MKKVYRYHFCHPVKGESYVERSHPPTPQSNQPGGTAGIEVNVPRHSPEPPVFVPWSNIAYVERLDQ